MRLLSDEQRLLDCLRLYINCHGYSPTIRELKALLGEPSSSVTQDLLEQLRQKGLVTWVRGKARTFQLLGNLVLRGIVQAGFLLEHPADEQQLVSLSGRKYGPNDYVLKVCGDSMIDANICDGDLVVIRPQHDLWALKPGHIAVIWIEGEGAALKHLYYREAEEIVTLKPANCRYQTRTIERSRVGLQGVLLEVHRDYLGNGNC